MLATLAAGSVALQYGKNNRPKAVVAMLAPIFAMNLSSLGRDLHGRSRFPGLVDAIRLMESVCSAEDDLIEARRILDTFESSAPKRTSDSSIIEQNIEEAEKAGAIFKYAVIVYARATNDQSKSRKKNIYYKGRIKGDVLDRHLRLVALRDKAIAHSDSTDHFIDGPWLVADLGYAVFPDGQYAMGFHNFKTNYRENLVDDLSIAIEAAEDIIQELKKTSAHNLESELEKLAGNEEIAEWAKLHPIDTSVGDRRSAKSSASRPRNPPISN